MDFSVDSLRYHLHLPTSIGKTSASVARPLSIQLMTPKQKGLVVADGRFQRELAQDVKLTVQKAEHSAVFVRLGALCAFEGGLMRLRKTERAGL